MEHRAVRAWCMIGLGVCACASAEPPASMMDASFAIARDAGLAADAGTVGPVRVGGGADSFTPLASGDIVRPVLGPQGGGREGGYHIWGAARAVGLDPVGAKVTYRILAAPSETELARSVRTLTLQPDGADGFVVFGLTPVLADCCVAAGAELFLEATIEDKLGKEGTDRVRVRCENICQDGNGRTVCP